MWNTGAGTISVTTGLRKPPDLPTRSFDALAIFSCSGPWVKMAVRYWLP